MPPEYNTVPLTFNFGSLYINDAESLSDAVAEAYLSPINLQDAELEFETTLPSEVISHVFDLPKECKFECGLVLGEPIKIQNRKHKKKRINKKWAKRYGFKTVYKKIRIDEVSLVRGRDCYEFEGKIGGFYIQ